MADTKAIDLLLITQYPGYNGIDTGRVITENIFHRKKTFYAIITNKQLNYIINIHNN